MINVTCGYCRKEFQISEKNHRRGRGKACSISCGRLINARPLEERFWEKVEKTETCWNWKAATNPCGYGNFALGNKLLGFIKNGLSHRISYELLVGKIPDGLSLDHLCRNRKCVNPAHLEPVTHQENCLRGINVTKATCIRGHSRIPGDIYFLKNGKSKNRACKECDKLRDRRAYWKIENYKRKIAKETAFGVQKK